ncbi:spore gernimation protein GerD [Lentibacillus cibarius]|uniref:Spore gernimation protein GerD n=1 Tax=Lentibacillus cibarius TaxID=2583219 RepID=A0A549YH41_9BACI|nr:spore germination lipoprotein GerD [Lentibacillus cibarius]TMN22420.1 spore gernimation protein GerD [Lentibacillus cibarius]TRM11211.1 spore gernimation protein GerD [Lentibacillus cibarius]
MFRTILVTLLLALGMIISGCNGQETGGDKADYDTTKKMVVDILQTEDGKKAIKDILSDEKLKQQLVINSEEVKKAINDFLSSDKATDMWKKLFEDTKFVKTYAKSMTDQHKKLMKELMNDSKFKQQMIDLLKDPQMTDKMLTVMKSQEFSKHLEETIQKTLESPLFQEKITKILLKAAEEKTKQQGQKSKDGGSEGGGSGGSGGGGGA